MSLMDMISVCARCHHCFLLQKFPGRGLRSLVTSAIFSSRSRPTHYEVLGLDKGASSSEIKAAYIKLSKSLHPDVNPGKADQHELFVQLNEAYGILGKPLTRKEYDLSLLRPRVTEIIVNDININPNRPFGGHAEAESYPRTHIFQEGEDGKGHENYYGIKGIKRVNNFYIVYGCVLFIIGGAVLHFFVIRQSTEYAIQRLDAKDMRIAEMYTEAKERARKNGPKKQMEILRERQKEFRQKLREMAD